MAERPRELISLSNPIKNKSIAERKVGDESFGRGSVLNRDDRSPRLLQTGYVT